MPADTVSVFQEQPCIGKNCHSAAVWHSSKRVKNSFPWTSKVQEPSSECWLGLLFAAYFPPLKGHQTGKLPKCFLHASDHTWYFPMTQGKNTAQKITESKFPIWSLLEANMTECTLYSIALLQNRWRVHITNIYSIITFISVSFPAPAPS